MKLHELLQELFVYDETIGCYKPKNYYLDFEDLKQIHIELCIADRFYEIAQDVWEQFEKEEREDKWNLKR